MGRAKESGGRLPPEHKHCPICGRVIPPDLEYCSTKCESIALRRKREEEFARKLMIILMAAFVLIVLAMSFLRG